MKLISQWLVHCILGLTPVVFSHLVGGALFDDLERPLGLDTHFVHQDSLLALHRALVEIESISGDEHAVGEYLEQYLRSRNFTVERQSVEPLHTTADASDIKASEKTGRFNILAYPGSHRHTPILLTSHIDTVPPYIPYTVRFDDEIWGRGTVDAKACVATQIHAALELLAAGEIEPEDIALLFVVGEEVSGDGMRRANDLGIQWDTVIFGEPTELKLASGHKGILMFTMEAHGKAGHSGYPWLGRNANMMLIPALAALQNMKLPSSEKYGNSTVNIGKIEGGVAANVIAESASADVAIRIAAEDANVVKKSVLDTVKGIDERVEMSFYGRAYGPVDIDHDVSGFETITVNYGTDIPNLEGTHKRYLYGPGSILVAHSDHEHVRVHDLLTAVEGYKKLIKASLGR